MNKNLSLDYETENETAESKLKSYLLNAIKEAVRASELSPDEILDAIHANQLEDEKLISTISVVCAVYNGARYIEATLQSIKAQTSQPLEIIIVDDGSSDDSVEKVKLFDSPVPLKIIRQKNAGQSNARNVGVHAASGDLIAFIDQDDLWYPKHLELLASAFQENPDLGWAYSDMDHIDESSNYICRGIYHDWGIKRPLNSLGQMLASDIFVLPTASMISKKALCAVGGFDESLSGYEDDDLYVRIFQGGFRSKYVPLQLSAWRIHSGSSSYTSRMDSSRRQYAQKLLKKYPDNPKLNQFWVRDIIAPRFFSNAVNRFFLAKELGDSEACNRAYADMKFFLPLMKNNSSKFLRSLKLLLLSLTHGQLFLLHTYKENAVLKSGSTVQAAFVPSTTAE